MKHSVREFKLANGAKGLVVNVPGSSVVSLSAVFRSGYSFGDFSKYEVPHVMEHLMGSGTEQYPTAAAFKTEVEKNGAYRNAGTSPYFNSYDYEFADFETERQIKLLGQQLAHPLFPENSFATEVSNVHEELSRNTSNYELVSWRSLGRVMTPSRVMEDETRLKQLPSITRYDIVSYYQRTHGSKNLFLFVAGDFSDGGDQVIAWLSEAIKALPVGERFNFDAAQPIKPEGPILVKKPIKQLYYCLYGIMADVTERERMAARLLSALYTSGYRSWIQGEARERGLAYHTSTGFSRSPGNCSFNYWTYVTPENAEELFSLFVKSHHRAAGGKFTKADLDATKDLVIGRTTRSYQRSSDMLGWYLGNYAFDEQILDFQSYLDEIRTITVGEVVKIANKLGNEATWGLSLVGDIAKTKANKLYQTLSGIWL